MRNILKLSFLLSLSSHASVYEHVAGGPRAQHSENQFSAYWAVWRKLSPKEQSIFTSVPGTQISQRSLSWETRNCNNNAVISKDSEVFWYEDKIEFDENLQLIPIPEAKRNNYLYTVLFNLNSLFLKEQKAFKTPIRRQSESREAYMQRKGEAYANFLNANSAKETQGELFIDFKQSTYLKSQVIGDFRTLKEFLTNPVELFKMEKYKPTRWPIYYDERAHKAHSLEAPQINSSAQPVETYEFDYILKWNWCNTQTPHFELQKIRGVTPDQGPNRSGRDESGYFIAIRTLPLF